MPDAPSPTRAGLGLAVPIALAAIGTIAVLGFAFAGLLAGERPLGDGRDPASYGFDLSGLAAESGIVSGSGNPRDFLQPLTVTTTMPGASMAQWNATQRTKFVVSNDRVVGLTLGGESRAWPVSVLNVHEVIHDTLSGVPIAVTYSPLCDSAVVFDRRIKGRTIEFGISGLVLDCNLLLYDRGAPGHVPSLWSQLGLRAVSGPLAGTRFEPLEGVRIESWKDWLSAHPDTTVPTPDDAMRKRIKATSYERYWLAGKPMFEVARPAPTGAGHPSTMERIVATLQPDGSWLVTPPSAAPIDGVQIPCLWFAWHAFHSERSTLQGFDAPSVR
jgi:hypothetical protein